VGGGIHSGAWAVEVLTRLQEIEGCADFPKRLCAISGTSGGSYGAMHYAHAMYHDDAMMGKSVASGKPGNPKDLDDNERKFLSSLRTAAQAPSLGAVVHSLAYHDLPSYFAPLWWFGSDRGTAMENQWAKNAMAAKIGRGEDLTNVTLAEWGEQAREGNMPAVLFTSGTEESGRPMIYGSSKVLDWNWNAAQMPFRKEDAYRYEDFTVPVITGARLSSSFPFVTPAARPAADAGQLRRIEHQMDGGYYDNYGLVALNRWLEDGLRKADGEELSDLADPPPEFTHILVIQIRYKNDPASGDVKAGGFFYQATAPLTGLYNARVAGQRLRADEQFDTFCRYCKKRGVVIDNAAFEFHDDGQEGAPLSWHLTEKQKSSVEKCGERILSEFGAYAEKHEEITAMNGEDFGSIDRSYPLGAAAFKVREFIRAQQGTGEMMILNPRGNAGE
jgi:hypothetical protein